MLEMSGLENYQATAVGGHVGRGECLKQTKFWKLRVCCKHGISRDAGQRSSPCVSPPPMYILKDQVKGMALIYSWSLLVSSSLHCVPDNVRTLALLAGSTRLRKSEHM